MSNDIKIHVIDCYIHSIGSSRDVRNDLSSEEPGALIGWLFYV